MASTSDILQIARPQVARDEGCLLHAYPDPLSGGHPYTVGYGATGSDIGPDTVWTQEQADADLDSRLSALCVQLDMSLTWWTALSAPRAAVLLGMAYNLGLHGLFGFPHMLACCQASDWSGASAQMLDSTWAKQLHYDPAHPLASRPGRLAEQMRTGTPQ